MSICSQLSSCESSIILLWQRGPTEIFLLLFKTYWLIVLSWIMGLAFTRDARPGPGENGCLGPKNFQDCPAQPRPTPKMPRIKLLARPAPRILLLATPALTRIFFPLPRPAPKQKKAAPCIPGFHFKVRNDLSEKSSRLGKFEGGLKFNPWFDYWFGYHA